MIHMNRVFYFVILINHLILVGHAADTIGFFPSGCQLGGALGRGGEDEDWATDLVGVSGRRGWRGGHLLVGELEPLSDGLSVFCGILSGWGGAGIRSKVWRKRWFATCRDH